MIESKMDDETREEWEKYLGGATTIPKYEIMKTFLETQFRILDGSSVNMSRNNNNEAHFKPGALPNSNNASRKQTSNESKHKFQ